MSLARILASLAVLAALAGLFLPLGVDAEAAPIATWTVLPVAGYLVVLAAVVLGFRFDPPVAVTGGLAILGGAVTLWALGSFTLAAGGYWALLTATWFIAWAFAERFANGLGKGRANGTTAGLILPVALGIAILVAWEAATRGGNVPMVLLPSPSAIGARIVNNLAMLWADFQQTVLKAVLAGYVLGNLAGLGVAIAVDRSPFLKRGLLPIGNFVSALPLVGLAPIMVMWFGFDWPSKAAVVVIMTFFPMLVNAVAGLNVTVAMERDLMRSYAAGYWQTLFKLRLPAAAPFIFNALKINSTLALIGAIVAEFFGTPVVGMGFRISTAVGRMDIDLVWAEIAVSALVGSVFYGVVALIERAVTFWHPSVRGGQA
jgi:NitT/TauT family transport system permease protein